MKILAIQVHTPFFYTLSTVGHEWYFVPARYTKAWGPERPMPSNCHVLDWKEARKRAKKGFFDLYIMSTEKQYFLNRLDIPSIYIEHNPTIVKQIHHVEDPSVPVVWNAISNATWTKRPQCNYVLYPPYLDFKPLKYKGTDRTILQVCKYFRQRPLATGADLWEPLTKDFPRKLAGRFNDDIAESIGYQDYEQIRNLYSTSRVYVDTKIHWYSTAVQEAILTGTPIVTIDINAPFVKEKEMIISSNETYLKKWINKLLNDPALAKKIGEAGRKAYLKKFNFKKYKEAWEGAFELAIDLYNKKIAYIDKFEPLDKLLVQTMEDVRP